MVQGVQFAARLPHLTTCLARGDCYFGARRTVVGSVTYRF